jgi:predicted transcriptional regulator
VSGGLAVNTSQICASAKLQNILVTKHAQLALCICRFYNDGFDQLQIENMKNIASILNIYRLFSYHYS